MTERAVSEISRLEQRVTITRNGVSLAGVVLLPGERRPVPCVAFVHGLGSGKDSPRNVVIAEHLVDAGIAALLFDLTGHGESSRDSRGQDSKAYVEDAAAAVRWLGASPEVNSRAIGIAGSSLGAVVALSAVQQGKVAPAAMVLRAPPIRPGDLDGLNVPTLVVVGSQDPLLSDIQAAAKSRPVTLSIVPGAGHLFEEPDTLERALKLTVTWFVEHLTA